VQPSYRRNEVAGWIKEGARDFSISRSAVQWGIPMAQDPAQTIYVWFDALNGAQPGCRSRHEVLGRCRSSATCMQGADVQVQVQVG
jgi:methionyl-tRNA synthetase